jgi:hypothetical protein
LRFAFSSACPGGVWLLQRLSGLSCKLICFPTFTVVSVSLFAVLTSSAVGGCKVPFSSASAKHTGVQYFQNLRQQHTADWRKEANSSGQLACSQTVRCYLTPILCVTSADARFGLICDLSRLAVLPAVHHVLLLVL